MFGTWDSLNAEGRYWTPRGNQILPQARIQHLGTRRKKKNLPTQIKRSPKKRKNQQLFLRHSAPSQTKPLHHSSCRKTETCRKVSQTVFQADKAIAWPLRRAHEMEQSQWFSADTFSKTKENHLRYITLDFSLLLWHAREKERHVISAALRLIMVVSEVFFSWTKLIRE